MMYNRILQEKLPLHKYVYIHTHSHECVQTRTEEQNLELYIKRLKEVSHTDNQCVPLQRV
jgi:hypothetical protein